MWNLMYFSGKNDSPQQRTEDKSSTGAIVGGVIGGLLFVALIIFLVLVLRRLWQKKAPPKQLPTATYAVVVCTDIMGRLVKVFPTLLS